MVLVEGFNSSTKCLGDILFVGKENGISFDEFDSLLTHEKIIELITNEVAERNKKFASFETIKKITLVPEFTIENRMMTPTFKIKKNVAMDTYKDRINGMYPKD